MNSKAFYRSAAGSVMALVGVVVLTAFAAAAPPGVRKLGLFALGFGALVGWIVAQAMRRERRRRWLSAGLAALLSVGGLVMVALVTHAQLIDAQQQENLDHPERLTQFPVIESLAGEDPELAESLDAQRRRSVPDFQHYLAVRTRPLGEWTPPWPLLFWIGELVLSAAVSLVVVLRLSTGVVESSESHSSDEAVT